jgi:predicted RNase H-like HicB family nuclease
LKEAIRIESTRFSSETSVMNTAGLRLKLTAVFEAAIDGGYTCRFEELPEVFSEGETLDEAKANLFDALKLVLEYHRDQSRKRPEGRGAVREELELSAL